MRACVSQRQGAMEISKLLLWMRDWLQARRRACSPRPPGPPSPCRSPCCPLRPSRHWPFRRSPGTPGFCSRSHSRSRSRRWPLDRHCRSVGEVAFCVKCFVPWAHLQGPFVQVWENWKSQEKSESIFQLLESRGIYIVFNL